MTYQSIKGVAADRSPYPIEPAYPTTLLRPFATVPTRGSALAAGFDGHLVAWRWPHEGKDVAHTETLILNQGDRALGLLGFAIELPPEKLLDVRGRSGNSLRGLDVALGTVDPDYRGEVGCVLIWNGRQRTTFEVAREGHPGDRVCQLVVQNRDDGRFVEAERLSETERGSGGFGSTGR